VTKPTANKKGKDKKTSKAAAAVANVSDNSQDSQQSEAVASPSHDSQQSRTVAPLSQKPLLQESQQAAAAAKLSKAAVKEYYHEILASRLCTPYHQDSLTLEEKILRHFDLSMQYGPAIGITRLNRWKRAHRMGFNPPVEVLAVVLQMEDEALAKGAEELAGRRDTRKSYMDDFLSSRCAGE